MHIIGIARLCWVWKVAKEAHLFQFQNPDNPFNPRRTYRFSTYAPAEGEGGWCDPPRRLAPNWARASRKKRACRELQDAAIDTKILGLTSTGDITGQVNDPNVGVLFLANFSKNDRRAKILKLSCLTC